MAELTANNLYWLATHLNHLMDTEESLGEMANPVFQFTVEMGDGRFALNVDYDEIYLTADPNGPALADVLDESIERLKDRINALSYALRALYFVRASS